MVVAAYPFERLPHVPRAGVAAANALARWLDLRPAGGRVAALVGGPVSVALASGPLDDRHAAGCEVRVEGASIGVRGASGFVRAFAQRVLSGPEELRAPRPLTEVEESLWVLVVASALQDLGVEGEVWAGSGSGALDVDPRSASVWLRAQFGSHPCTVELRFSAGLGLAAPPARPLPPWVDRPLERPVVVGRCGLARADLAKLARRSVITLDRALATAELAMFDGAIGLRADSADPLVARVATGYVPRPMALPDDARVELTVGLGTARLSLRQVLGLAIGEVLPLGRPLAGPFDVRAEGTLIGQGELVDVDGELGVRIVSLAQE